ncbi:Pancreatic lipase-related protein 2 [Halotydeus destructor]|nr:Pancreatic lipase-related protein 2 [Halotydeus destructor]
MKVIGLFLIVYTQVTGDFTDPRIRCSEYAESHGKRCDRATGLCFSGEARRLVDACLYSVYLETPDKLNASVTEMTPDKDQHTGYPRATIPPADFTQFNPYYGSMDGYEEPNYHLGLLPQDPITLDTRLMFHDRQYARVTDVAAINSTRLVPLIASGVQHNRIFIVSQDFNNQYQTDPMFKTLIISLIRYQLNATGMTNPVIMVDTKTGSQAKLNGTFYKQAAANAILIGRQVGTFIYQLTEAGVDRSKIHLIGYGLGAQILHFAARWFTRLHLKYNNPEGYLARVGRLTGLDPVAAHFEGFRPLFGESPHIRLTDALRVDVITTSAGEIEGLGKDLLKGNYGMAQVTGMRHFYPNAGNNQPRCSGSINSPVQGVQGAWPVILMCSHQTALQYFINSLQPAASRAQLTARQASDWIEYIERTQANDWPANSQPVIMGIEAFAIDNRNILSYYLSASIDKAYRITVIDPLAQAAKVEYAKDENRILQIPPRYDSEETFPTYPIQEVPNAITDPNDAPSCGKFRSSSSLARVFRGQLPYDGQFPWVVCVITRVGRKWRQTCTGAILSSSFILTAAHCFDRLKDGSQFFVTYGTADCMNPPPGMFKKIIFSRQNTVLILPKYPRNKIYDVSLIRLLEPIAGLPVDKYNGELVNTLCLHANQQYDNMNLTNFIYVAGFGIKGVGPKYESSNLTWTYSYRRETDLVPEYTDIFNMYGRDPHLDFYFNDKMYTTCGGDSGGSYAWYVNTQDEHVEGVSDYRAVVVSIVNAGLESCNFRYYNDLTSLGIGSDIALQDRILCSEYAENQGISCDRTIGFCYVAEVDKLIDACLVSMYLETPHRSNSSVTQMTPDWDQHTGYPNATIPPMDFTQYHPLYGSMTGYEEPNYHLGLLPQDPITLDTRLVFPDSKFNKVKDIPAINSEQLVPLIKLDAQHQRIFIVAHDFNSQYHNDLALKLLVTSLIRYRSKITGLKNPVILVDSKTGTKAGLNGTFYKQAAANAILIGREVGTFIYHMTEAGLDRSRMHLIGYGLGAQILHFAARWFTRLHLKMNRPDGYVARVGRLTGLDPVAAHFEGFRPLLGESPHIMLTDARRVDVITTSAGKKEGLGKDLLEGNYGMAQLTAMRHFYPNAGHTQPRCKGKINSTIGGSIEEFKVVSMCSHKRALQYFVHSLQSKADRVELVARRASDWETYVRRTVSNKWPENGAMAMMGIEAFDNDNRFRGSFYVCNSVDNEYIIDEEDIYRQNSKKERDKTEYRSLQVPTRYDSEEAFTTYPIQAVPDAILNINDAPSCGKFRGSNSSARIFRGQLPYGGQFPWVVCIITGEDDGKWQQTCTGAILSDTFILTAAHCFDGVEDETPFYITYGTTDCFKPPEGMFKKVVFKKKNTVIIMKKYSRDEMYDVALIRLIEPIVGLPVDNYNGELINTICLHTNQQYDDADMMNFLYVAGFGTKGVGPKYENSNLTWTYSHRTSTDMIPEYTELFPVFGNETFLDFYQNEKGYTTCGGDSGASYSWYVNTQDGHVSGVSDYRAVVVSIVKAGLESCNFRYYNDLTSLGIGSDIAVNMRQAATFEWVVSKMADRFPTGELMESADCSDWEPPSFTY